MKHVRSAFKILCVALLLSICFYIDGGLAVTHAKRGNKSTIETNVATLTAAEAEEPVDFEAEAEAALAAELADRNGSYVEDETAEESAILAMDPSSVEPATLRRWYGSTVLLGDSIVYAGFEYHWLGEAQVLGEIGAALFNSESQFEEAIAASPSVIFLCFGMNDLGSYGSDVDQFIEWYTTRIRQLQQDLPDAVIYVHAILPAEDNSVIDGYTYREEYNQQLSELCTQLGVYYVDGSFILEQMPELYDTDGLHPLSDFYPLWFTYLADVAGLSNE